MLCSPMNTDRVKCFVFVGALASFYCFVLIKLRNSTDSVAVCLSDEPSPSLCEMDLID